MLHRFWKAITTSEPKTILYTVPETQTEVDVILHNRTIWLTQKEMSELFQTSVPNINMHLKNIYEEGELDENSTIKDFLIVQNEGGHGVRRKLKFYKLDAIISVGYRTNSHQATHFRVWAQKQSKNLL